MTNADETHVPGAGGGHATVRELAGKVELAVSGWFEAVILMDPADALKLADALNRIACAIPGPHRCDVCGSTNLPFHYFHPKDKPRPGAPADGRADR